MNQEMYDDDICIFSIMTVGKEGSLHNGVFDFNVPIFLPDNCKTVFAAPIGTLSGSVTNVSFTGSIKFTANNCSNIIFNTYGGYLEKSSSNNVDIKSNLAFFCNSNTISSTDHD